MPALLCQTLARALIAPVESDLKTILDEYGWDSGEGLLISLARLVETLHEFNLGCVPPIGELGLDDARVVSNLGPGSLSAALEEIANGETEAVEFKSSLLLDLRKYRRDPRPPLHECRMDSLLFGVLKSICALANSSGGTLYVGVEDNGEICGLEDDFRLVDANAADYDRWNLFLRSQVESRFFDGRAVNSAFKTSRLTQDGKAFVQVQVVRRGELSFIKKQSGSGGCELYIRSGTRSIPIDYQDIQKHFEVVRKS